MEVNLRSFCIIVLPFPVTSLIFYKDCLKHLVYPSAKGGDMAYMVYIGSCTYSDSKVRKFNREDLARGGKAPNPNNSKQTWHHRGVIVKRKESEMSKRQYKHSGYFLFIYFLIFYSCVNWPHLFFSFNPWRENMGDSLITKFPQDMAFQRHLNRLFRKIEERGTT